MLHTWESTVLQGTVLTLDAFGKTADTLSCYKPYVLVKGTEQKQIQSIYLYILI
jgi:hypothetical protein